MVANDLLYVDHGAMGGSSRMLQDEAATLPSAGPLERERVLSMSHGNAIVMGWPVSSASILSQRPNLPVDEIRRFMGGPPPSQDGELAEIDSGDVPTPQVYALRFDPPIVRRDGVFDVVDHLSSAHLTANPVGVGSVSTPGNTHYTSAVSQFDGWPRIVLHRRREMSRFIREPDPSQDGLFADGDRQDPPIGWRDGAFSDVVDNISGPELSEDLVGEESLSEPGNTFFTFAHIAPDGFRRVVLYRRR
eukprot:gnl/TRDRNA2_/TRDRNA2_171047_c1_seq1.p1 gnl/TRDRNA2_/TRDRNA2_171047_c1~~gnl/TRDRNA2_/TRDRNA2_171047_c1_seq1.p1  ORF type:complete len:281 (+),score=18.71 gnl/TRDRNA2_/TRDRNA2_171047_c1_seq1:103-843(+)